MKSKNPKQEPCGPRKEAKDREEEHYEPNRYKDKQVKNQIRLGLWEVHLKSPLVALSKALDAWNRVRVSLLLQMSGDFEVVVQLSLPLPTVGWTFRVVST